MEMRDYLTYLCRAIAHGSTPTGSVTPSFVMKPTAKVAPIYMTDPKREVAKNPKKYAIAGGICPEGPKTAYLIT